MNAGEVSCRAFARRNGGDEDPAWSTGLLFPKILREGDGAQAG